MRPGAKSLEPGLALGAAAQGPAVRAIERWKTPPSLLTASQGDSSLLPAPGLPTSCSFILPRANAIDSSPPPAHTSGTNRPDTGVHKGPGVPGVIDTDVAVVPASAGLTVRWPHSPASSLLLQSRSVLVAPIRGGRRGEEEEAGWLHGGHPKDLVWVHSIMCNLNLLYVSLWRTLISEPLHSGLASPGAEDNYKMYP